MPASAPVLEAADVTVHYPIRRGVVRAVEGASVRLVPGKITALVGESGSGKSTLARALAGVETLTAGTLLLEGAPMPAKPRRLIGLGLRPRRSVRARREYARQVQMVLQDPFASLNPLHTVRHLLTRPLRLHGHAGTDIESQLKELLERVRLAPPEQFLDMFPHQLSGGQRQRVAIARALAVRPRVLLGDEPVSMLDVSMRLDVLNLLARFRDEDGLAVLYITHDIASARYIADEITVMYAGEMVESGPSDQITGSPAHPYTQLLLAASPDPERTGFLEADEGEVPGDPPDLTAPPPGCRFHPRCPFAMERCSAQAPPRAEVAEGQWARCWLVVS